MSGWLRDFFRGFGSLRIVLLAVVGILVLLAPVSGGTVSFDGIALITTLVAPVAFAIFVFVLPLDMMMTAIFRSDASQERRRELGRVLLIETAALLLLILSWLPFVLGLLRVR